MKRVLAVAVAGAIVGAAGCAALAGLDAYRGCDGAECLGDGGAESDAPAEASLDAADAASCGVDLGAAAPLLTSLDTVVWLDPCFGQQTSGGKVTRWLDRSAAKLVFVSDDPSNPPVDVPDAVAGYDALRFVAGTYGRLASPDQPQVDFAPGDAFAVFAVVAASGDGEYRIFTKAFPCGDFPAPGLFVSIGTTRTAGGVFGTVQPDDCSQPPKGAYVQGMLGSAFHVVALTHTLILDGGTGGTMVARLDGKPGAAYAAPVVDYSNVGVPMYVGEYDRFDAGTSAELDLAELIVLRRTAADFGSGAVAAVEEYLTRKYKLAP